MKLILHTDGGSRGNPGPAAFGFIVLADDGEVLLEGGEYLGVGTNNEAEYQGLVAGLSAVLQFAHLDRVESLDIKLDSQLVVEQALGHWKIKEQRLLPFVQRARQLLQQIPCNYRLFYVPRAENALADAKVNSILDAQA